MTDQEILQIDFYDLCGVAAVSMTNVEKIKYWRKVMENIKVD